MDQPKGQRAAGGRSFIQGLKDLLVLHKAERRGNAALMVLLLAAAGAYYHYRFRYRPGTQDLEPYRAELEAWLAERDTAAAAAPPPAPEPFPFNPNAIGEEAWQQLGLSARQAASIERYKAKGGRFRVKGDLGRMRALRPEQYERLRPFILLPDSLPKRARSPERDREAPVARMAEPGPERAALPRAPARKPVEVNAADSAALVALPGIGPAFARGIIRYRERLGGYYSLDQLQEVHILRDKPEAVERIKGLLTVDTLAIRRIPLNTCTAEELAGHPYIRWELAKPIIAYRGHHGPFRSVEGIKALPLIDAERYRKLAPYLSAE